MVRFVWEGYKVILQFSLLEVLGEEKSIFHRKMSAPVMFQDNQEVKRIGLQGSGASVLRICNTKENKISSKYKLDSCCGLLIPYA